MSPFKVNYGQDPRMGFKGRKKEKYKATRCQGWNLGG